MTISRVCTVGNCWQWANFTMGSNVQNQHFAELRQKVCLYRHALVLPRGLPSFEGKNKLFVGIKEEKVVSQTEVRQSIVISLFNFKNEENFNSTKENSLLLQLTLKSFIIKISKRIICPRMFSMKYVNINSVAPLFKLGGCS